MSTLIVENYTRYYLEDLSQRDFHLEFTSPFRFIWGELVIEENNWGWLIQKLSQYLYDKYPQRKDELLNNFKTDWSKQKMFSTEKGTNFKSIADDLYVNCNQTALHSCWLIQDILSFYNVNPSEVKFYIFRSPAAEPKEIRQKFIDEFKQLFTKFLNANYRKTTDDANKIISNIENYINPIMNKISQSYNDARLFSNYKTAYIYLQNLHEKVADFYNNEKAQAIIRRYISYLKGYYKELEKNSPKDLGEFEL